MTWWQFLLSGLAGLVISAASGVAYAAWRDRGAQRAASAVRRGRSVPVPVTVVADGASRGHAVRDGDDVRIVTASHHLLVARDQFAASGARRERFDDDLFELADLRGFTDEDGRRYDAGPALEWSDGFDALLEVPAPAASRARVVWAGASRVAIGLAVAAAVAAGLFQLIWWAGHDQPAGVVRHVSDGEEVLYCGVRWTDGSGEGRYAEVDCYEPYPAVGRTISVRALAWPFEGSAMDDEGSFEVLTTLTLAPAALALATGLGLGLRRAWRAPVRLRAVAPGSPARADLALEEAQGLPLRALARRVAEREGWAGETDPAPTPPGPWAQVRMAAGTARWWPALPLAAIAGLSEGVSTPWRAALAAGGAVLLLWALGRTAGVLREIRSAAGQPVTSEWDYLVVRTVEDEWVVLLLLGDTPHWSVVLQGAHPLPEGRCGVRGELHDGRAVHLVIGGETWVPAGPVVRLGDVDREDLREDLVDRLVGRLVEHADSEPIQ